MKRNTLDNTKKNAKKVIPQESNYFKKLFCKLFW